MGFGTRLESLHTIAKAHTILLHGNRHVVFIGAVHVAIVNVEFNNDVSRA